MTVGAIRPPAVAGRFYPDGARQLADLVDALLGAVPPDPLPGPAAAYVVPHAGYRFSGPTAAHAYARLRRHAGRVRRVVLIGPAHFVPLAGCAAPEAAAWSTALGEVPVDVAGVAALARAGLVAVDDRPHTPEHSLEVQLPFLQRALPPDVPVLPVVVGRSAPAEVAALLATAAGPDTVVLCSTDLSHYLVRAAAEERDARTCRAVLDLAPDRIGDGDACGAYALRGLLAWAAEAGLAAQLLWRCTSADAPAGDPSRVVGYASAMLTPPPTPKP